LQQCLDDRNFAARVLACSRLGEFFGQGLRCAVG
jgi:hypothetical protein